MRQAARGSAGFTLIEMLVAILIFSVLTLGLGPLLASSLRGTALARELTLSKAAAQEAMERARGLPYYKAIDDQRTNSDGSKTKEDLLDLFYPCASTDAATCPGYSASSRTVAPIGSVPAHSYVTTCTSTSIDPACGTNIDEDFTLFYVAQFKTATGTTSVTVEPPNVPGANYSSSVSGRDSPPSQLLDLAVIAAVTFGNRVETYRLESLIGDRKFGEIKIIGNAIIDYGISVETSFVDAVGTSTLTVTGGSASSSLEQRLVSSAAQDVLAGRILLVRQPTATNAFPENLADTPKSGASVTGLSAPPASSPAAVPAGAQGVTHPSATVTTSGGGHVAFFEDSFAENLSVTVADEKPTATGAFRFTTADDLGVGFFYVQNQADTTTSATLRLSSTRKILSLHQDPTNASTLTGSTQGVTGELGTSARRVEMSAGLRLDDLRLFPVTFIKASNPQRVVLFIEDFVANVNCKSTASTTTGSASSSWSATLKVWVDPANDGLTTTSDPLTDPAHVSIPIDSTMGATDLKTILAASPYNIPNGNPLVYDDLVDLNDVYLFDDALVSNGYLDINGFTIKNGASTVSNGGVGTAAEIDQAIGITTVPTNPTLPESGLRISMGKLRCDSLDAR